MTLSTVEIDVETAAVHIDVETPGVDIGVPGPPGPPGPAGSADITATPPATYDAGTATVGVAVGTTSGTVAAGNDSRITGAAQKSANLSDLANATTARTNLGAAATSHTHTDADVSPVAPNDQTGTTYTFVLADRYREMTGSNASAQTFTIPPNSSVAFPLGAALQVYQKGAGQITVAAGSGVTLRTPHGAKTSVQYAVVTIIQVVADIWVVTGDTAT